MLIQDEINRRRAEGRLFHLKPALPQIPVERTLLLSEKVNLLVTGPWPDTQTERRCGRLRADFDAYIANGMLSVAWEPYKAKTAYFGRLDQVADEIWDIRSRDPKPAMRILGSFADTDVFVALEWEMRHGLGGPGSKE